MKRLWLAVAAVGMVGMGAQAATYTIDANHSSVAFKIKHIVGKVIGNFATFDGTFNYDPANPAGWSTTANIDPASIKTGIDKRDAHLKSPDFFDVLKFPKMSYVSTSVSGGKVHGNLTMHGVTKPVDLDLTINGVAPDPMGKGTRAGASAVGHINRSDFGIGATTGPMASMIGTDVEIDIEVEGVSK